MAVVSLCGLHPRCLPPERWIPPPTAIHKLNVDGSFNLDTCMARIGGILRNDCGGLIQTFACATVTHSALEAELQALLRGLQLCAAHSIKEVIIEGDSFIIWNSLHFSEGFPWSLMRIWRRIQASLTHLPRWTMALIRRSANSVADRFAKLGLPMEILFNTSLPMHIWNLYLLEQSVQALRRRSNSPQSQEEQLLEHHEE